MRRITRFFVSELVSFGILNVHQAIHKLFCLDLHCCFHADGKPKKKTKVVDVADYEKVVAELAELKLEFALGQVLLFISVAPSWVLPTSILLPSRIHCHKASCALNASAFLVIDCCKLACTHFPLGDDPWIRCRLESVHHCSQCIARKRKRIVRTQVPMSEPGCGGVQERETIMRHEVQKARERKAQLEAKLTKVENSMYGGLALRSGAGGIASTDDL